MDIHLQQIAGAIRATENRQTHFTPNMLFLGRICKFGFGQERFLKLHIEKEHFDNSSSCRFQINIHGHLWIDKITALINKLKHIDLLSFINHEERFTACQGAVWQEEDMAHITFY